MDLTISLANYNSTCDWSPIFFFFGQSRVRHYRLPVLSTRNKLIYNTLANAKR